MASVLIVHGELDKDFNARLALVIGSLKKQRIYVSLLNIGEASSQVMKLFRDQLNRSDEIVFFWPKIEELTPWQLWQLGAAEALRPVSRLLEDENTVSRLLEDENKGQIKSRRLTDLNLD